MKGNMFLEQIKKDMQHGIKPRSSAKTAERIVN